MDKNGRKIVQLYKYSFLSNIILFTIQKLFASKKYELRLTLTFWIRQMYWRRFPFSDIILLTKAQALGIVLYIWISQEATRTKCLLEVAHVVAGFRQSIIFACFIKTLFFSFRWHSFMSLNLKTAKNHSYQLRFAKNVFDKMKATDAKRVFNKLARK